MSPSQLASRIEQMSKSNDNKRLYLEAVQALRQSDYQRAIDLTEKIIELEPEHAKAHAVQFSSLFKSKQHERARQMGGRAAQLNPDSLFLLNNQACLQLDAKQPAAAAGLLRSLINQFGERAQWLYNLALAQRMVGNLDNAISVFRQTLKNDPEHDRAAYQLAECYQQLGDINKASNAFDMVRMLRTKHAPSHAQSIQMAATCNAISEAELEQELRLWTDRFVPKTQKYPYELFDPDQSISIGFILGQMPDAWLQRLVVPLINRLAEGSDSVYLYSEVDKLPLAQLDDSVTLRNDQQLSDSEFARLVRADKIDVLVDLAGMRAGNRQRALSLGVAKNQFSWLGHLGKTPNELVPILEDKLGVKKYVFTAPENDSAESLPINVFAAVGTKYGLSSGVIVTWSIILKALPEWKIHFDCSDPVAQKSLIQRFKALDIDAQRLMFDIRRKPGEGTIVLDNYDCNDPIAIFDALINRASIVAMQGRLFPAQQSAMLFKQVGFGNFLLYNPKEYIDHALALATGTKPMVSASTKRIEKAGLQDIAGFAKRFRAAITA